MTYISTNNKNIKKVYFAFAGSLIILYRILAPGTISHNLFIILSVAWLGPFLVSFKFFSKKLFVVMGLIFFIYDLFYVSITSLCKVVYSAAAIAKFPMGIIAGNEVIGMADLFWAAMCIVMIKSDKHKIFTAILFMVSDILLNILSSITNWFHIFPLLVAWVPIGIILVLIWK